MEELNILEFIKYYFGKLFIVVLFVILGTIGSYFYTYYMQVPVYRSQTSLVLTTSNDNSTTITQNDVTLNKNLVSTYREIIKSRRILDKVIDQLDLPMSYETLKSHVEVSSISDTELIVISVYDTDSEVAKKIADKIAEVFEEEIIEIYNIENVSIIDTALVSGEPYNVNVIKQFVIGAFCGFLISSIIIALMFYMDDTVKTEEDIENKIGLSVLGSVGRYKTKRMENELIINIDPKAHMSEAIRTLRTNLQFSSVDKKIQTILVTSSVPGEGKSFIAANLAVALANSGSRVLLVDCDIRKGRQHRIFKSYNKKGLSNLLLDDVKEVYGDYVNQTVIKNLSTIYKGMTPPNPSELLNSEKNKQLIEILSQQYDIVIFDGAPINGLPDSLIMGTLVDGVIVVTAYQETSLSLLEDTKRNLENVKANILGVVLNRTENKNKKYYGSYYG
ncbi:MAG: polysaccharide biosynthesis tyrosine autokinase [bacterium]|nr:polysaccharide biosynthesis tyrosine autokinase [bacterium]